MGVTVRHNSESRGAGGRNHESPQKDSHGPQEPGLSLHLDRPAGQKTPACILTHRQVPGPGLRTHRAIEPQYAYTLPGRQGNTTPSAPKHQGFWSISRSNLPCLPIDSIDKTIRLGITVAFARCYRSSTVEFNHMGRMHGHPDRSTDGICGLRCWPAGKRWVATLWAPYASSAASFCKHPASLLVPVVSLCFVRHCCVVSQYAVSSAFACRPVCCFLLGICDRIQVCQDHRKPRDEKASRSGGDVECQEEY